MPTKQDVQRFADLVEMSVKNELQTAFMNAKIDDHLPTKIYETIFQTVIDVVNQVAPGASNELVNCITQNMYASVRLNDGEFLDTSIIKEFIDPKNLPENERPFIYAFFAREDESE